MIRLIERADAAVAVVARLAAYLSALGVLSIVVLLVASSLMRYVLGAPIPITEELAALLFLATAFLSLTYGFTERRHVRLELLWNLLPSPWREAAELLGLVLAVVALGFLISVTWSLGLYSLQSGGRSEMTEIVLWPWRMLMSGCLGLFLVAVVLRLLTQSIALVSRIGQRSAC
jgi:TRAP-type C4-dicarboxylate transport system permease small subunit